MQEAIRPPVGPKADDEDRILVPELEELVQGHREPALRLAPTPLSKDRLEPLPQAGTDLARPQDLGAIARPLEPVDGLAHLPDRPSLEREGAGLDHRLVAVVERVQAMLAIQLEAALRGPQDRDAPVAGVCELDEVRDEGPECTGCAHWVSRDDRDSAHDFVGDEGAVLVAEEVRLFRAQNEGGKRVGAPFGHEGTSEHPVERSLPNAMAPGCEPRAKQGGRGGEAEQ